MDYRCHHSAIMVHMASNRIESIVFDLGNVLIPWNPRNLYKKLFPGDAAGMERFLATICTQEWNDTLDSDVTYAQGTAQLTAKFPGQQALIEAYDRRWEEMLGEPIAENVALLSFLHRQGWPVYALSNWSQEKFPIALSRFAFLSLFRGMVISGEVGLRKPDPAIFRLLLERYSLEPASTLFIDDTSKHCETARSLGIQVIQYLNPGQLRNELINMGVPVP